MEDIYTYRGNFTRIKNPSFEGIIASGAYQPDISGITFFVNNEMGNDYNNGKSLGKPFRTFQQAIDANNYYINRDENSIRRNTIFLTGNFAATNLTVFPNKCDVIGVGTSNNTSKAVVVGCHTPNIMNTSEVRFFNIYWKCPTFSSQALVTLNASISGCAFRNCAFEDGTVSISNNSSPFMVVQECYFRGTTIGAINLEGGSLEHVVIEDCIMTSGGVSIVAGVTVNKGGTIINNTISSTTKCINDLSNKFYVIDNRVFTGSAKGTNGDGAIQCNLKFAQNNRITATNVQNAIFPAQGTI